ncbi:MAG: hypothetical protein ACXW3D_01190 [Caulobacteraceae bacterium]
MDELRAILADAAKVRVRISGRLQANCLTPEMLQRDLASLQGLIEEAAAIADQIEAPQFELSNDGLQALGVLPRTPVRFVGRFGVINGDRA